MRLAKVLVIHPYHLMSPIHLMPLVHRAQDIFLLTVRSELRYYAWTISNLYCIQERELFTPWTTNKYPRRLIPTSSWNIVGIFKWFVLKEQKPRRDHCNIQRLTKVMGERVNLDKIARLRRCRFDEDNKSGSQSMLVQMVI